MNPGSFLELGDEVPQRRRDAEKKGRSIQWEFEFVAIASWTAAVQDLAKGRRSPEWICRGGVGGV